MSQRPNILVIAPSAPPAQGPESIQVGRILTALDRKATGRLITVAPTSRGWSRADSSLALTLEHFDRQALTLPLHTITHRLLTSHRFAGLHQPDSYFWIRWLVRRVRNALPQTPDIIYSRSSPFSAALLARDLKRRLNIPWIMHLSDPWANSPYKPHTNQAETDEASCFATADRISLTTEGQASFYRQKYPKHAAKIFVTPNVMAEQFLPAAPSTSDDKLHLVFAGNLYGTRSPAPLVQAIDILRTTNPAALQKLHIDIYGNLQDAAFSAIQTAPDIIHYHGPVSFHEAYRAQQAADVVLSIEPKAAHPLDLCFLPSKVVDCLALRKPLLALTPIGSETQKICEEGHGWAISPNQPEAIAARLSQLTQSLPELRTTSPKTPPARFSATAAVDDLLMQVQAVLATGNA